MMTSDDRIAGLKRARFIAWLFAVAAVVALAPPIVWVFSGPAFYVWLKLDLHSRPVMLVERIFDFSNNGAR